MKEGRKIPKKYENPYNNIILEICEYISPTIYKLNITPNIITTIGVICTILSIYKFCHNQKYQAAIFWYLQYFFDCLDGYIARKYNMETEFGDYYDHITDVLGYLSISYLFYCYQFSNLALSIFLLFT